LLFRTIWMMQAASQRVPITHDDELLWDVVAFVRKLPEMTPEQYETLVKNAPKHEELMHEMEMGGDHDHDAEHP
jgi:hypothetical protein